MNKELISIIIPTYNRADYLPATLESIIGQTFKDWECIIVDDGSTDNTEVVISEFLKDPRFKFLKRPTQLSKGANSCRNYGFEQSTGKYIKWFDSDDLMLPTHLEDLVDTIRKNNADFAVAESENFDDATGKKLKATYIFDRSKHPISADAFAKQQIGWITDDFLGKRISIDDIRFNPQITTDGDEYNFFSRYLLKCENGVYLNKVLTRRRIHTDALSSPTKYSEVQFLEKVCTIKFQTFLDIKDSERDELKKWFLKGYMLNAYFLAKKGVFPIFVKQSFPYITRYYSLPKAIAFMGSIILGFLFKKGYFLLEYSRV